MSARVLIAAAVASLSVATPARAQEWPQDVQPTGGYDVSVDLNVQGSVGTETFHDPLLPYGDWVVVGSYGRVWRPHVAAGWRPYYYGRWEWTNEGWLWVSDEPWGWAVYHYGRWAYDPYYGWLWVPGYQWAPAWVSWRTSGDAVGWAPLAPGYSVYVTSYPFIDFWWTFVPCVQFASVPVYSVAYAPTYARRWYDATAPAPAYVPRGGARAPVTPAWGGPAPRVIEQRTGRALAPARIVGAPGPAPGAVARSGEIPVYRPDRQRDRYPPVPVPTAPERWSGPAQPQGNHGRGPGPAPAPGWSGQGGGYAPGGNGRGPGTAASPGWSGQGNRAGAPGAYAPPSRPAGPANPAPPAGAQGSGHGGGGGGGGHTGGASGGASHGGGGGRGGDSRPDGGRHEGR